MKTKERCLQFIENINDTAERLIVGNQYNRIPVDKMDAELKNIIRWVEYLQDSIEQDE